MACALAVEAPRVWVVVPVGTVTPNDAPSNVWIDRALARIARAAHRRPWRVLLGALFVLAATWFGALVVVTVYVPLNNQPIAATSSVFGILTLAVATVLSAVRARRARAVPVEEPAA